MGVATEVTPQFAIVREGLLLTVILIATAVMAAIERRSVWSYGLDGPRALRNFLLGCGWGLVLLSLLLACLATSHHFAIDQRLLHGGDILVFGLIWAVVFVGVGIAEESLFRGYLQSTLARIVGFWPAVALLSLAFGLVHLRNQGEVAFGIVVVALGGAVFGLCLRRTGSLWWGIGFHTAWDWGQSFLYGTPDSGYLIQGRLLQSHPIGNPLWSGGAAGPEGSVLIVPVLCMAFVIISLTLRRPLAS